MKKLFLALTGITFIMAFILTAPIYATSCQGGAHAHGKKLCETTCLKGLTDQEKQAAQPVLDKFFKGKKELRTAISNKKNDLAAELSKKAPDKKVAYKLHEEISNLKAKLGTQKIDFVLEMKKINPDIKCPKMTGKCPMSAGKGCCPMKHPAAAGVKPPPECPAHKKNVQ